MKKKRIKLYWQFCRRHFKPWWKKDPLIHSLYVFIGILGLFLFVVLLTSKGGIFAWLLGTNDKKETIQFIALGIGGTLAAIGAVAFSRRANAQMENNKLIEKGYIDERFKSATENLGNSDTIVRISAFYQFYYLAKNHPDVSFRNHIFDILCAHLRNMTSKNTYRGYEDQGKIKPTEECQTLLNVLFKPEDEYVFNKFRANLQSVYLFGADLEGANLSNAILLYANFTCARLSDANFTDANLACADFTDAYLDHAIFHRSHLMDAKLINVANVRHTDFRWATVTREQLPINKMNYIADWTSEEFWEQAWKGKEK